MLFSVVTPSFRDSSWLKLCIASVADQELEHEHIVQDSCSDDGTQDWLPSDPRVKAYIERDAGMYDAINRGLQRAKGEILAYLNCDEQYLAGSLTRVAEFFWRHPSVDVAFASAIVVDESGNYLCYRQPLIPKPHHVLVSGNLPILTCATFFRRRVLDEHGLFFDPGFKASGDAMWILALQKAGMRMAILNEFTSIFTDTGANMGLLSNARREKVLLFRSAPVWVRLTKPFWIGHHRLRRLLAGHYCPKPFAYSVYTKANPHVRIMRHVRRPSYRWVRGGLTPASVG